MPAMIGPVGIYDQKLRHGGISFFFFGKIFMYMQDIRLAHGKSHLFSILFKPGLIHFDKSLYLGHIIGQSGFHLEGKGLFVIRLPGIHRVYAVFDDLAKLLFCYISVKGIDPGELDNGLCFGLYYPYALGGRIRPLVILAGKILGCEHLGIISCRQFLMPVVIQRRLGKNRRYDHFICILVYSLDVIPVNEPQRGKPFHMEILLQIFHEGLCFCVESGFFLHIDPSYHLSSFLYKCSAFSGFSPVFGPY